MEEVVKHWIENGASNLASLKQLREYVEGGLKQLSVTKMRKFYESVVKIRNNVQDLDRARRMSYKMVILLRYELGRATQQKEQRSLEKLLCLIEQGIESVEQSGWNEKERVVYFLDLMEAVVAFHREKAETK